MLLGLALMQRAWGTWVSLLALSISPIVLGLGAYLGLRPFVLPTLWGKEVMMLSNALTALPFVTASLRPRYGDITGRYARLCASYGVSVWAWWMHVVLPNLAPTLGFSIGVSLALSMGDLGVILLFSDAQAPTLPQMIYAMMGQYRIDAATSAAILLMIASFSLFAICSWIGERYARL
jgi:thiamine transport system permease protein